MTLDEISMAAYKDQKPDIHDLTVPEWLLWYRLRDVYRECAGDPKTGAEEKQRQVSQYEQDRNDWVRTKEVYQHMTLFWKRIEPAASKFALDQTVPNAVAMFEAVYQVPIKAQLNQWDKEEEQIA